MKISDALAQARRDLDSKGVSNSKLDSLILLTHTLSFSKEQVIFNPDLLLDLAQQQRFFSLVECRKNRQPVSQIIGKREFFGENFLVTKDVLDPRPDSENLIELVIKNFPKREEKLEILELGVGSGCLIITLLKTYNQAIGIGVDISSKALEICRKNAETHNVLSQLKLSESNLFSAITNQKKFNLIISNPPYIASEEIKTLEPEVRIHEPLNALDGGEDGLDFYRRIALEAGDFLTENGKVVLEIGQGQKEKIVEIFSQNEFLLSDSKQDLSGIWRILEFKKK